TRQDFRDRPMRANRGGRFFGEASGLPGPSFLLPSLPAAHYTFSGTPGQKVFYENLTGGAGSNRNFKRQRPRGTSTYESASPAKGASSVPGSSVLSRPGRRAGARRARTETASTRFLRCPTSR